MRLIGAMMAYGAMRVGDIAGFGTVESTAMNAALRRTLYVAGIGVVLVLAAPLIGIPAAIGLVIVGLALTAITGGLMLAADMNQELATMLAMPPEPAPAPVAQRAVADERVTPPPLPLSAPVRPARRPLQVLSRGEIDGRSYAVFTDGSIEIETIFGPRWFASVDLAHEFIGYRKGGNVPVSQVALAS